MMMYPEEVDEGHMEELRQSKSTVQK